MGRPVISTYVAGIPELVKPGVNGWLVPAGALEPLVEAMAEALTADPKELDMMGSVGAVRVAQEHDVSTEAGKLAELFSSPSLGRDRLRPQPARYPAQDLSVTPE